MTVDAVKNREITWLDDLKKDQKALFFLNYKYKNFNDWEGGSILEAISKYGAGHIFSNWLENLPDNSSDKDVEELILQWQTKLAYERIITLDTFNFMKLSNFIMTGV